MSYVRALPATQVQTIITRPNDVEQPLAIVEKMQWGASLIATGVGVSGQTMINAGAASYNSLSPAYGVTTTGNPNPMPAGAPNDGTGQPGRVGLQHLRAPPRIALSPDHQDRYLEAVQSGGHCPFAPGC